MCPRPTAKRDAVLKYLRNEFPFQHDLRTADGKLYAYPKVREAFYSLTEELKNPKPKLGRSNSEDGSQDAVLCVEHFATLSCYMNTRLTRTRVAETVEFDQSTVKRKLDAVADKLLETLAEQEVDEPRKFKGRCEAVLKYIRNDYPAQADFEDWDGQKVPYLMIRKAVQSLQENDPEHLRILNYFMNKELTRTAIAKAVEYDQSTIKRKLDAAASTIMSRVLYADFWAQVNDLVPGGLFQNWNPYTNKTAPAAFPVTNWWIGLAVYNNTSQEPVGAYK
jgi:predicted transcriptional regulator